MQFARGVGGSGSAAAVEAVFDELGLFVVTAPPYNATGDGVTDDTAAIQAAIDAAEAAGGVVMFPGGADTLYGINAQLTVTASNITLSAPGGARLKLLSAIPVAVAVGDIDTGVNTTQGNTLASNAAAGAQSVTLSAGKGANFAAGEWALIISTAVVPDHHSAVVVKRAEFINIFSKATDTLTLSRPLRYTYNTADTAEIYKITWVEGFAIDGLGIDGNNHTNSSIGFLLSWCMRPQIRNVDLQDLQQRGIRLQGCFAPVVDAFSQSNGRSHGFQGASNLFSYCISEGGPCEGGKFTNLTIDRCRHGYTTSGMVSNSGASSPLNTPGFGVPTGTLIKDAVHTNARGAGWDTHETGLEITFENCQTLGGLTVGFQDRAVRSRWINCFAADCVGAPFQFGTDAQSPRLVNFRHRNCNLGTDEAGATDWTIKSPIVDTNGSLRLDTSARNEADNGNFQSWRKGTSFTASGRVADRWELTLGSGAAVTVSRQNHTVGESSPLAGRHYLRFDRTTTGSGASDLRQRLGGYDVTHLAGRTVCVSFTARAENDPTDLSIYLVQNFGSGGSPSAPVNSAVRTIALDGNFRRYNCVIDIPSITGKTLGTTEETSYTALVFELATSEGAFFFDIDSVKLEIGDTPTAYVPESRAENEARAGRWWQALNIVDGYRDGATDDTTNIQGMLTSVGAAGGGIVFLPRGVYRITTLTMSSPDVELRGEPGTILETTTTGADIISVSGARSGCRKLHVRTSGTATAGSHFRGTADDVFFEDCVSESGNGCVRVNGGSRQHIEKLRIISSVSGSRTPIEIGSGGSTAVAPVIKGCLIQSTSGTAVAFVDSSDALFSKNQLQDNGNDGVTVAAAAVRTRILGNLIAGSADDGLVLAASSVDTLIDDNVFQGNTDRAINIGAGATYKIGPNNVFSGNGNNDPLLPTDSLSESVASAAATANIDIPIAAGTSYTHVVEARAEDASSDRATVRCVVDTVRSGSSAPTTSGATVVFESGAGLSVSATISGNNLRVSVTNGMGADAHITTRVRETDRVATVEDS